MNKYLQYLLYFIVLVAIGIIYDKYKKKNELTDETLNNELIQKYLLNDNTILGNKPILWIHTTRDINARHWSSFLSRNNSDLNQPYISLCIQSLIKNCGHSFNVVLIDDHSFSKLIPGWNINISETADPIKSHLRTLALCKLLYYFGGLLCPNSFLCLKDMRTLYDNELKNSDGFMFNDINDSFFIGSRKHSPVMRDILNYLSSLNSTDFTNQQDFLGNVMNFISSKFNVLDGKKVGTKTENGVSIIIDDLLEKSYIDFDDDMYGIWLPSRQILIRNKYNWFARLSKNQLLEGDLAVSGYFVLAQ